MMRKFIVVKFIVNRAIITKLRYNHLCRLFMLKAEPTEGVLEAGPNAGAAVWRMPHCVEGAIIAFCMICFLMMVENLLNLINTDGRNLKCFQTAAMRVAIWNQSCLFLCQFSRSKVSPVLIWLGSTTTCLMRCRFQVYVMCTIPSLV